MIAAESVLTTPAFLAVIGTVVGGILAYLGVYRRLSGKIATSDAAQLWKENDALRTEYRDTIKELRDEIKEQRAIVEDCDTRIAVLEADNERLHKDNSTLQNRAEQLTRENERLTIRIETQAEEIKTLKEGLNAGQS